MPLQNVLTFRTEREAVNFAIADRRDDRTNYNLEKPTGAPFDRIQVEALLKGFGYKEYAHFALDVQRQVLQLRGIDYCETMLVPLTQNPHVLEILNEFVKRPKRNVVGPHRAFHERVAGPVRDLMQSQLLTLLVIDQPPHIHATEHTSTDKTKRAVPLNEVTRTLDEYVRTFNAPLAWESTGPGEFRIDERHVADPKNPHSFRHLHVVHRTEPYETTLRLERG